MNISELDHELYENARANVEEENQRRQETIKTLNEYGLYFIQRGLTQQEFQKIRTVAYNKFYGDIGYSRCSICLTDFKINEKLKQFPNCEHLYHIKCLDIWLNIEPTCPNCLRYFLYPQINSAIFDSNNSERQNRVGQQNNMGNQQFNLNLQEPLLNNP